MDRKIRSDIRFLIRVETKEISTRGNILMSRVNKLISKIISTHMLWQIENSNNVKVHESMMMSEKFKNFKKL